MKRYIKDGIIKTRNQIVIKGQRTIKDKDGNEKVVSTNTYNPTEEMILADGWEEYITPVYERTIEDYRRNKIHEINHYDSSSEVNIFYIGEMPMWFDKATRLGLKARFEAEIAAGSIDTTLWYNGKKYDFELTMATQLLRSLEIYASKCYDNTQTHLAKLQTLMTIEEIESYDYKVGYPQKVRL